MVRNFFSKERKKKTPKSSPESSSSGSTPQSPISSPLPSSSSSSLALRIQNSDDLRQVFDKFDTNGDGKISLSELESMLQCLGSFSSTSEVESIMKAADVDGDGFISLEEFVAVNTAETDSGKCIEDLRNAFTVFDRDQNGLISADELCHVLKAMGEKTSLGECKKMIKGIDRNGDGAVNFEEFIRMMTRSCK